ncbi:iron-containing alcohol dehydrogenase [Pseudomonas asplenii]|uniref:iron-containing alcohol dehydrogenase n=1 Tax=Pseudomonas asplenii TaxID=53407 RepID=UPI00030E1194|nr:iron-containing alcohol dehydrogenase [Pseudomonas fuscovaginae]
MSYHFQTVKHLVHGAGSLDELPQRLALLDTEVKRLVLITQNAMHKLGVTQRVVDMFSAVGISVHWVDQVEIEPTLENIEHVFREQIAPQPRTPSWPSVAAACWTPPNCSRCC